MPPPSSVIQRSPLLALPYELREAIFKYCLPQYAVFDTSFDFYGIENLVWTPPAWILPVKFPKKEWYWVEDDEISGAPFAVNHCLHFDARQNLGKVYRQHGPFYVYRSYSDTMDCDLEFRVCHRCWTSVDPGYKSGLPGLVLSCRQICEEVEALLYGNNDFLVKFTVHDQDEVERFSPRVATKIRHIVVVVEPYHMWTEHPVHGFVPMCEKFWSLVGPGLKTLKFIVNEPDQRDEINHFVTTRCITLMKLTLEHLYSALAEDTQSIVDANGEKLTQLIFETCLPRRCRYEPLRLGDPIFDRAEFAVEEFISSESNDDEDDDDDEDSGSSSEVVEDDDDSETMEVDD